MSALSSSAPVAVIGAGTMGAGIAQVAACAGHEVRLFDAAPDAAGQAIASISRRLDRDAERGRLTSADARAAAALVRAATSIADLAGCQLVVEAVVEDLDVKRTLFAEVASVCGADAVLATNTSSLSVTDIASRLDSPGRVVGMHFFNPAPVLPLVEVVSGESTDPAVAELVADTARAWGKTPVRAASTPGFIVNRVARPFYAEAFRLLAAGVADPATIDALFRQSGGFRMGPCELTDLIGQDVNAAVSRSVWEAFGRDPRFEPSPLQEALVEQGRLGRKTGRGWYDDALPRPEPATVLRPERDAAPDEIGGAVERSPEGELTVDGARVILRTTDGRTAAQHTGGGPDTLLLLDLVLDAATATRVGLAAPSHAPATHVAAAIAHLHRLGYDVTMLPDSPGLVVARTVAMLASFAADAVDAGVATADDVDTAMRLGVNYPRGPYAWGEQLGWRWVAGVLDALAASEAPRRYRVSPGLRARAWVEGSTPARDVAATARALARRAADAMWADDAASQALGMTLLAVEPGSAQVSMVVRADMVNGHGIAHGGLIFALADSAFAFAGNSYNRSTVAHSCDITFLAPAREGDLLVADARERHRGRRSGIYDVTVHRGSADGEVVAEFRGRSREIAGTLVDEETT